MKAIAFNSMPMMRTTIDQFSKLEFKMMEILQIDGQIVQKQILSASVSQPAG